MGTFAHLDVLCARRAPLIYVSPPICENDFSSTGEPVIILNPLSRRLRPTGFRAESFGGGLRFKWDTYPGAICFSIYKAVNSDNPNGEYTLVAECIEPTNCDLENPETLCYVCPDCEENACYRISAITLDGESELSDASCLIADFEGFPTSGFAPLSVTFTDASVGDINSRFWDFGDGSTLTTDQTNFVHQYLNQGTYTVSLTVTGDSGSSNLTRPDYIVVMPSFPPGTCPDEPTTPPAPETFQVADEPNTDFGTVAPDPSTTGDVFGSFGSFDLQGNFRLEYAGGAYKDDDNPNPGSWKVNSYRLEYEAISDALGTASGASQAAVEGSLAGYNKVFFYEATGSQLIRVKHTRFGSATNFEAGSPNPSWRLIRTSHAITQPLRVRIVNWEAIRDQLTECSECFEDSGQTQWDGTMPTRNYNGISNCTYRKLEDQTLDVGPARFSSAVCQWTSSHPTSANGFGWRLFIYCAFVDQFIMEDFPIWIGIKAIGETAAGKYYADQADSQGCVFTPGCLDVEEY